MRGGSHKAKVQVIAVHGPSLQFTSNQHGRKHNRLTVVLVPEPAPATNGSSSGGGGGGRTTGRGKKRAYRQASGEKENKAAGRGGKEPQGTRKRGKAAQSVGDDWTKAALTYAE